MTLLELTEPLFQYICRLNRAGRRAHGPAPGTLGETAFFAKGGTPKVATLDYAVVRSEIKALLDDMAQKADSDGRLINQFKRVELGLVFFVDAMISESSLPFAAQWNQHRLAYDRNELAGDEKFFDLVEETLKDPGEEASERLAVFYTCIGLGFVGIYFRQPEYLRKTMLTIAPRIRHLMEADQSARVCPETYEKIDTRDLVQPPGSKMALVAILFACFMLAVVVSYIVMYREASTNLSSSLDSILQQDPAPAQK